MLVITANRNSLVFLGLVDVSPFMSGRNSMLVELLAETRHDHTIARILKQQKNGCFVLLGFPLGLRLALDKKNSRTFECKRANWIQEAVGFSCVIMKINGVSLQVVILIEQYMEGTML